MSVRDTVREDLQENEWETCSNEVVYMNLNVCVNVLTSVRACVCIKPCSTDTIPSLSTERSAFFH